MTQPAAQPTPAAQARANNRLFLILGLGALGMMLFFLLGFRGIYTLFCTMSGTAMRPNNTRLAAAPAVATGRYVAVRFESRVFDGLPVQFAVEHAQQRIEVGVEATNTYVLTNLSAQPVHVRPVHQVSPINATPQFAMRICFCFQDQIIAPHQTRRFPVTYRFAPALDQRINDIALCYSVFDVKDGKGSSALQQAEQAAKKAIIAEPEE